MKNIILILLFASRLFPQSEPLILFDSGITYNGTELITNAIDRTMELGSEKISNPTTDANITGYVQNIAGDAVYTYLYNNVMPITGGGDVAFIVTSEGTNNLRPARYIGTSTITTGSRYIFTYSYQVNSGTCNFGGLFDGATVVGAQNLTGSGVYRNTHKNTLGGSVISHYWDGTHLLNVQLDNHSYKQTTNYTPNGNHSVDTSTVYKQANSYSCAITASAAGNGTTNTISLASTLFTAVTNGLNYRFQVYAYTSTANTTLTFKLGDIVKTAIVPTTGMSVLNFDFKATASSTGNILLYLDKAATVYIDEVSLKSGS